MNNQRIRIIFSCGVGLALVLIAYGLLSYPTTLTASPDGWRGLVGVLVILVIYEAAFLWGTRIMERTYPSVLRTGLLFGTAGGLLFAFQLLFDYLYPMTSGQDGTFSLFTFGALFLLFFLSGIAGAWQTGHTRHGIISALWSALVSSLAWFILLWIVYFAFTGTAQETRFLEIDQTLADFQRSGMSDLRAFIMQDYLGAGFFHLILGPIAALIFGFLGGLFGSGLRRFVRKPGQTQALKAN
jgi:hypothetical protein